LETVLNKIVHEKECYKLYEWKYISTLKLSESDYERYLDHLDWDIVSEHIDPKIALSKFRHVVNWDIIAEYNKLDVMKFILEGVQFSFEVLVRTQVLDEKILRQIIRKMTTNVDWIWTCISKNQKLNEKFMEEFLEKLDHFALMSSQNISFDFILRNKHRLIKDDVLFFKEFTHNELHQLGW
jgi:hypothetical protein